MTAPLRKRVVIALAVLGMASGAAGAQTPDRDPVEQFERSVNDYVALRHAAAGWTSPAVSSDFNAVVAAEDALAQAIRAARPRARTGDLFSPQVAHAFRLRIEDVVRQNRHDTAGLLEEINREAPSAPAQPTVNARFDWQYGAQMPGDVIQALPSLPSFLQYRFVSRDLLLIDIEADLIVDVLPDALAHAETSPGRPAGRCRCIP